MMNRKSVSSLAAAASVFIGTLLAPSGLTAQITPEQDKYADEENEVRRYIDHAREIVQRIRMGLKHCTAKGDSIECASPKSLPLKCTFMEKKNRGWWPSTERATLDCEVNGTQHGLAVNYTDFPVPFGGPLRNVEYRTEGENGDEMFRIDLPTPVTDFVTSCTAVQTRGDHSFFNGCTEQTKMASIRVNQGAIQVMNRAARILRKGPPKK